MNRERMDAWNRLEALGLSRRDCDRILRDATGMQRRNEIQCSIDVGEAELARMERKDRAGEARVRAILATVQASPDFNGDPRGYPFSVIQPDGRAFGVPGVGLPARCFA